MNRKANNITAGSTGTTNIDNGPFDTENILLNFKVNEDFA